MNTKELRIGSYVKTCLPDMKIMVPTLVSQVQGLGGAGVQFGEDYMQEGFWMNPNHVTGVELTQSWLDDFGLTTLDHIKDRVTYNLGDFVVTEHWHSGKWGNFYFEYRLGDYFLHLKYVHQLQNIYQVLGYGELKIQENTEKP